MFKQILNHISCPCTHRHIHTLYAQCHTLTNENTHCLHRHTHPKHVYTHRYCDGLLLLRESKVWREVVTRGGAPL